MAYLAVRSPFLILNPIIVANAGFLLRVLYPSVLFSYVFTNMHKPNNWEDPQDDNPYTEIVAFAVSLSTASFGIVVKHLYAENSFMWALHCFQANYTVRRIL